MLHMLALLQEAGGDAVAVARNTNALLGAGIGIGLAIVGAGIGLGRIGGQVAEAETAAAGGMNHLMVRRLDLGCRDAPTFGGCAFKHGARRRADLAHWDQIVPRAARSVGILIAEFDFISVRLHDLYA